MSARTLPEATFSRTVLGSGPGLLLAHGAGSSIAGTYGPILDGLAARHTVVGIDYPGSGDTPRSTTPRGKSSTRPVRTRDQARTTGPPGCCTTRTARWRKSPVICSPPSPTAGTGPPSPPRPGPFRPGHAPRSPGTGAAQSWGTPRTLGISLRTVAVTVRGRQGLKQLEDSVGLLEEAGATLEQARSLVE